MRGPCSASGSPSGAALAVKTEFLLHSCIEGGEVVYRMARLVKFWKLADG